MKIKVLTFETKLNKKQEAYFLLKADDKHSYNLPGKVGTPTINGEYEIEYEETAYEFQGKQVKSKWVKTFKPMGIASNETVQKAQDVFGGKLKAVENQSVILIDPKTWDDAIKLVASFINGKKGDFSADEIGDMIKKCYNQLLKTKGSL